MQGRGPGLGFRVSKMELFAKQGIANLGAHGYDRRLSGDQPSALCRDVGCILAELKAEENCFYARFYSELYSTGCTTSRLRCTVTASPLRKRVSPPLYCGENTWLWGGPKVVPRAIQLHRT